MIDHLPRLALLAIVPLLPAQDAPEETKRDDRLTLDLLLEWESVGSPTLSPDGGQVVYSRTWTDKIGDRRRSELWIMNADGSRKRALVDGSSPQWSPDGTRIAYVAEGEPEGSQIWVMWADTRETGIGRPTRIRARRFVPSTYSITKKGWPAT